LLRPPAKNANFNRMPTQVALLRLPGWDPGGFFNFVGFWRKEQREK